MMCQKIYVLALVGVFCLCAAADGDGGVSVGGKAGRLAQRARRRYGVKRFEERDIGLPEELPGWFSVEVEYEGVAETLELERCSVRGPNFEVLAQGADGRFTRIDPGPERTYRGRLKGHPGSVVAATLAEDGLRATIRTEFGRGWGIRPMRRIDGSAARRRHIVFCEEDVEVEEAVEPGPRPSEVDGMPVAYYGGHMGTMNATATAIGAAGVTTLTPHGSDVMQAEAGIDVEYDYFAKWNAGARDPYVPINNNIATTMNEMNIIFVRDCMIEYVLGRVVIRTSAETCPYHDIDGDFSKLGPFRTEWRNNQSDSAHDLAALVYDGGGGMAWVGVVCGSYAYSINGDSGDGTFHHVWRHEAGHNWGCADYHKGCPEGRTILCGNSMAISRFSIEEVKTILAHRDSRSCLVNIGPYASSVPPYAGLDVATVNLGDGPIRINVLENDHDANGDAISVDSYDETSMLGGSVVYTIGGRGGPPALVYTPPKDKHGNDRFTYTIADGTGNYAVGTVAVEVRNPGPTGHWKLDEVSGMTASDSVGSNDGVLTNMDDADWVSGQFGSALEFDDVNDYLYMEDFSMSRDAFTAALWFKPAQDMDSSDSRRDLFYWHRGSHPHLTFNRGGDGKIGLYVEVDDVEYNDVTSATTAWSAARWYHIAATFDGSDFVLYVDGVEENRVSHPGVHVANEGLSIGSDEGARGFGCRIDDVRFYNYALSAGEVAALLKGGRAEMPKPANRLANVRPHTGLQWTAGLAAVSHDVYLGTSQAAVANATAASYEYKGRVGEEEFLGPKLAPNQEYFWRVDEIISGGESIGGTVWSFVTGDAGAYESVYEAEDAEMSGPEIEDSEPGYTGSGYVDYINWSDDWVEYTVFAHYAGAHTLKFRYALPSGNRPLEIRVNGKVVTGSLSFPATGSWSTWGYTADLPVTLQAGLNTIRGTVIGSKGANVDHLKVTESDPPGLVGDFDGNGEIDAKDFADFAGQWGRTDCADNPACGGADLDGNRNVNEWDLAVMARVWLEGK